MDDALKKMMEKLREQSELDQLMEIAKDPDASNDRILFGLSIVMRKSGEKMLMVGAALEGISHEITSNRRDIGSHSHRLTSVESDVALFKQKELLEDTKSDTKSEIKEKNKAKKVEGIEGMTRNTKLVVAVLSLLVIALSLYTAFAKTKETNVKPSYETYE